MVEAYGKQQPTPGRIYRLNGLLYQAMGRAPDRDDLRRMLAENLLKSGDYAQAEEEAKKVTGKAPAEALAAKKVIALSLNARARAGWNDNDREGSPGATGCRPGNAGRRGVGHGRGRRAPRTSDGSKFAGRGPSDVCRSADGPAWWPAIRKMSTHCWPGISIDFATNFRRSEHDLESALKMPPTM